MENAGTRRWLRSCRRDIVDAVYNVNPFLDILISKELLQMEDYHLVKNKPTPQDKIRCILDLVQSKFSPEQVEKFAECLKQSESCYPKLKKLKDYSFQDEKPTPTEQTTVASSVREDFSKMNLKCGEQEQGEKELGIQDLVATAQKLLGMHETKIMEFDSLAVGMALGLSHKTATEALETLDNWDGHNQLTAILQTFLVASKDPKRLRSKLAVCQPDWFQVSPRGAFLLNLLSIAQRDYSETNPDWKDLKLKMAVVVHECLVEVLQDPHEALKLVEQILKSPELGDSSLDLFKDSLQKVADHFTAYKTTFDELSQEIENNSSESWQLLLFLVVQLVRELFRKVICGSVYRLQQLAPSTYECTEHSLWSVTSFDGLRPRNLKRIHHKSDIHNYPDLCSHVSSLLKLIVHDRSTTDACNEAVNDTILKLLKKDTFGQGAFDGKLRARLLFITKLTMSEKFGPLLNLYKETYEDLKTYTASNERHRFSFLFEKVHVLTPKVSLCGLHSSSDLAEIDGSMEETFEVLASDPAKFLFFVKCKSRGGAIPIPQPFTCKLEFKDAHEAELACKEGLICGKMLGSVGNLAWVRLLENKGKHELQDEVQAKSWKYSSVDSFCIDITSKEAKFKIRLSFNGTALNAFCNE
uniref:CARD domain-containing protein n=1 Tax=Eptatretus burgeri TaxID=7764 RepID=A0A8C4PWC7_EPTBU